MQEKIAREAKDSSKLVRACDSAEERYCSPLGEAAFKKVRWDIQEISVQSCRTEDDPRCRNALFYLSFDEGIEIIPGLEDAWLIVGLRKVVECTLNASIKLVFSNKFVKRKQIGALRCQIITNGVSWPYYVVPPAVCLVRISVKPATIFYPGIFIPKFYQQTHQFQGI